MKVDVATVRRLAELSKLSFSKNEETEMVDGLNEMIAFVDKLKELDTANVEPLVFMTDETNVLREDVVESPISQAEALKNAPSKDMYYFRVPKVIKQ
ncbi:MAG: Asp-tRNA(Asn)/Glu-tRNA(Gln) amidotransferase subunit GatC [Flavobacteriia bacterium]|nr:Asp-tRNA(Asn)/Glu-tRNA(Gln) amidotransferase subunit GatC [Flavobacteriia bacterium]